MRLHGKNFIGAKLLAGGSVFHGMSPATGKALEPAFHAATEEEIDQAMRLAEADFQKYRQCSPEMVAAFLERIGEEILGLGDELIQKAREETALPEPRLVGERARTINQLKMFADLIREGSWVEAHIDRAIPDRKPLPKPDVRRMLIPIGPVVVFGASNFPLAFSVAGGDTASALASGNCVVVKAHPAHPGTSEFVASAIRAAMDKSGLPAGVFSMVHGPGHEAGVQLVTHPSTRAVGFTGSFQGGKALWEAAARRPDPIPVYAEMGSTNPIFVLPGALKQRGQSIAEGLAQSVTLGVGQFCTNPGLVFGLREESLAQLIESAGSVLSGSPQTAMLSQGIQNRFQQGLERFREVGGIRVAGQSTPFESVEAVPAVVFATDSETFRKHEFLREELFGPATLVVSCRTKEELLCTARELPGQLTATIHGTEEDLAAYAELVAILQQKAGRLVFNGFPTGVEVCPSMHHGGPYPATTDSHFTSVGTGAIKRFARPVCFQNFPEAILPPELQSKNPRGIWRVIDGRLTRSPA
jgi:alpha-ketoglutaric semialdehyde dehydrogenase